MHNEVGEERWQDRLVGWACKTGLPRMSEFEFGCTGFDGLGLHGLGLVLVYTKYIHCLAKRLAPLAAFKTGCAGLCGLGLGGLGHNLSAVIANVIDGISDANKVEDCCAGLDVIET
ncbi:hypothetical protein B0H13DRAFT_1884322 [Mycena leptocephala]|nr:hypothetical protein B0H13DRAFT_1884322 [Mycena leptocephala]